MQIFSGLLNVLHWILSYLVSAGVAAVTLMTALVALEALPSGLLADRPSIENFLGGIIAYWSFIPFLALPAVFLTMAVPELIGAKPRARVWGGLGVLAAFISLQLLALFTILSAPETEEQSFDLEEFATFLDFMHYIPFLIAGGFAGLMLGQLRKRYTRSKLREQ